MKKPSKNLVADIKFEDNNLNKLQHKCKIIIPETFIICGEGEYQYCSEACLENAKRQQKPLK